MGFYDVIALDLDGTLTNSNKEVTDRTKEIIAAAIEQEDAKIVLASGRPVLGIEPIAEALDLYNKGGYILAFNGGKIIECATGEVIYQATVDPSVFAEICSIEDKFPGATPLTYDDKRIVAQKLGNPYLDNEAKCNSVEITKVDDLLEFANSHVINKFLIVGEHDLLEEVKEYLAGKVGDSLELYYSAPYFLEVMPKGIEKAASLGRLLAHVGSQPESLMACGDGMNDLHMLEFAGLAVVMDNGCDEAKMRADYITKSNDEDGVAYAIEKFVLETV